MKLNASYEVLSMIKDIDKNKSKHKLLNYLLNCEMSLCLKYVFLTTARI